MSGIRRAETHCTQPDDTTSGISSRSANSYSVMSSQKLLTIFGSTGNQGGSVIDLILSDPELQQKYRLRGISRNASSDSAQNLGRKGVEMISANVNNLESLKAAVRGSYGVFGVTNFWDKDVMSKTIEIQQGKNIFEACKADNVTHFVFSALPNVERLTQGVLKRVEHFDGKAIVAEYVEANKGHMIASYFMPAMYLKSYKDQVRSLEGRLSMIMPFSLSGSDSTSPSWPVVDPREDSGKYIIGLFEGGKDADGVSVHAVSAWSSPKELLAAISREVEKEVNFAAVSPDELSASLPENIAHEITETMLLVGNFSYYGRGEEKNQDQSDEWLVKSTKTMGLEQLVQRKGPWNFT
ncbi:NAD(P)-binding protein [Viridothelium virens]|uniref:NAD(P)-binding protein n=1 Tax=Viridothelium virens TaxID=1048519 RepID=A0A6A6HDX3_VIRVR|nr:NAD(P)-binding protein [Viridothelium virens]